MVGRGFAGDRIALLTALFHDDIPLDVTQPFLTPCEVARLFEVSERTVGEWARNGQLRSYRTPGGRHRFSVADVRDAYNEGLNT